jgi:two-component system nitrogen regulation sensor histidine kinase NtrY
MRLIRTPKFYILLFAAITCIGISFYFDQYKPDAEVIQEKARLTDRFRSILLLKEEEMRQTFSKYENEDIGSEKSLAHKELRFYLQVYEKDSLAFWNDHSIQTLDEGSIPDGFSLILVNNGYYLLGKKNINGNDWLLFYLIKRNYRISNIYLENSLNKDFGIYNYSIISGTPFPGSSRIGLEGGKAIYIKFEIAKTESPFILFIFLAGIICFMLAVLYLASSLLKFDLSLSFILVLASWMALRVLMINNNYPQILYRNNLFNPALLASSYFYLSMGDLVFSIIPFGLSVFYISYLVSRRNDGHATFFNWFSRLVFILFYEYGLVFLFRVIRDLVHDSKISFDLSNAFDLSWNTLVCLVIILLAFITIIKMGDMIFSFRAKNIVRQIIMEISLAGIILVVFNYYAGNGLEKQDAIPALIFLSFSVLIHYFTGRDNYFLSYASRAIVFSFLAGYCFYSNIMQKELDERKLLATRLTSQIDYKAEEILSARESQVQKDSVLAAACINGSLNNIAVAQYLGNNYFNNYLKKFDCSVSIFRSDSGRTVTGDINYEELNESYRQQDTTGTSAHFRFIRGPSNYFGYIGRFDFMERDRSAILFVLLKLRPYQDENLLPVLITSTTSPPRKGQLRYSYAIYNKGRMMQQSGSFQYPFEYNFGNFTGETGVFANGGYSHLVYQETGAVYVVVSTPEISSLTVIANGFSLFVISILLSIFFLFVEYIFNLFTLSGRHSTRLRFRIALKRTLDKYGLTDIRFRSRILINIIMLVLLISIVSSAFTLNRMQDNIDEQERTILLNKLRSMRKYLNDESELNKPRAGISFETVAMKLATLYNTDINIYSVEGRLLGSSKMDIFSKGLLSNRINYYAFDSIVLKNQSFYSETEKIGTLKFLSSYEPYFDNSGKMQFIINVPYFSRSIERYMEISKFIVNFLSLYVVIIIFLLAFAYLVARATTRPFILLREKLKLLKLESDNEMLTWRRNDEIGELVREYNKMVLDLKESRLNLSLAERTGAWREMAKQVAHDIKNPLTPMKLNLQYLQRAVEENDPDLDEKYKKVSKSLLRQIETLTEMANNFSNFAKAPEATPEILKVNEELDQLIELYNATESIEFQKNYSGNAEILMDKNHFLRALGNIIKNATQAIPAGEKGTVFIEVKHIEDRIIIAISDNGLGISREVEPLIFVPNFSSKTSGSGLGLSIARTMIENAGGSIRFISKPGQGTTFFIEFPAK